MHAGFSIACMNPPLGTRMVGWMSRDHDRGCDAIHDPIRVRTLYLEQNLAKAMILSLDLCFVDREFSDELKTRLLHELGLSPNQILVTCTHSHAGPSVSSWGVMREIPKETVYRQQLIETIAAAARKSGESVRAVRIEASTGRSRLPMNRRRLVNGRIENAPNPSGPVCDALPVCHLVDEQNQTVCLLFSVAAHPVIFRGFEISAEFPGETIRLLEEKHGIANAMFLQGPAGDSRPSNVQNGESWNFNSGWSEVRTAAQLLAREVSDVFFNRLQPRTPVLRTSLLETFWPLQPTNRGMLEAELKRTDHETPLLCEIHGKWCQRQLAMLETRGLPTAWPILIQGIQLAEDARIIAIEGEPVAEIGLQVIGSFREGVTFAIGYSNGEGAYLPTSKMLPEGGYEVEGYWEYGLPSPIASGVERIVDDAMARLRKEGIT